MFPISLTSLLVHVGYTAVYVKMFGIIYLTVVFVFVNSARSTDGLNVCQVVRPFVPLDTIEILPYKFAYDYSEELNMFLSLTDVCEEITAVRLKTTSGGIERIICLTSPENGFYHIQGLLEGEVSIVMEIYTNSIDFPVKCVLELSGGKDRWFFEWNTNRCKEPPCLLKISLHEYCTGLIERLIRRTSCSDSWYDHLWWSEKNCNKNCDFSLISEAFYQSPAGCHGIESNFTGYNDSSDTNTITTVAPNENNNTTENYTEFENNYAESNNTAFENNSENKNNTAFEDKNTLNNDTYSDNNTANETKELNRQKNLTAALAYGIGGMVGACVVAFLVYVWVRQRCNKPDVQATMELNTYSTANPVLYADLEFARSGNTNRVHVEEPYAQVIGVLKPTKT
ncbi:uncharacterized protein LOC124643739 [Helicoverpa zea]|uniref:uncharacterized protein LOC124643739 n=1 Tax=Helicoverpa zea TaxID=7113 RepID=UPI001F592809|nr:uncharacterized protein LOC124643739 [Helicoverpa zea]